MDQSNISTGHCRKCGRLIKEGEQKQGADKYCLQCAIEIAESSIPETKKEDSPKAPAKNKGGQAVKIMILIIFAALTLANTGLLLKMVMAGRQTEAALPEYSKDVELCRENVANIASVRELSDSLACPSSGKPYQITVISGDTFVLCPNPEAHGIKAIKASYKLPKPEVLK